MIQTSADFEESTQFERLALATVFPLASLDDGSISIDFRSGPANITAHLTSYVFGREEARSELINELRPLLFGAAWKILDLLLELAFNRGGLQPKQTGRWTIAEKQKHARAALGSGVAICTDGPVWGRLTNLYVNTAEARHCLIHRSFKVDPAGAMLDMRDNQGNPCPDITAAEQAALCRLAQSVAEVVLANRYGNRERSDVAWWCDQLVGHHQMSLLGGAERRAVGLVIVNAVRTTGGWEVDTASSYQRASESLTGCRYFNVEIHFPGTGLPPMLGRLEEASRGTRIGLDPANPPSWVVR